METKELIEKLIAHYEQAIEKVKAAKNWNWILEEMNVHMGICKCAYEVFKANIYHKEWVAKRCRIE